MYRNTLRSYFSLVIGFSLLLSTVGSVQANLLNQLTNSPNDSVTITPGNTIEIAVAVPTSIWPTPQDHFDAVQMALDDFGSIKGFEVQQNQYDSGCSSAGGQSAANNIVANAQNVGVVGPFCSSGTTGAAPVFESAGVVMISQSSTGANLYTNGPNVFNRLVVEGPDDAAWDSKISALLSVKTWEAKFNTTYGRSPDGFAKYAYDAATLLLTRIDQVSSLGGSGNLLIDRAALATAVRVTTDFIGVTGQIALDVFGNRIDEYATAVGTDSFDGSTLDGHWSWINEDPSHWSLIAKTGVLRITTQQTTKNRLVQDIPRGDFEIRTRVVFTPTENFQFAGLSVYADDQNQLAFGRAYCDDPPPACVGNGIYFDHLVSDSLIGNNFSMTTTVLSEVYLRLVHSGSVYTATVSTNGTEWMPVGTHTIGFTPTKIGLIAHNGTQDVSEIPSDFDFFVVESTSQHYVYLPLVTR